MKNAPRVVYQDEKYPVRVECDPMATMGYVLMIGANVHLLERGTLDAACESDGDVGLVTTLNASDPDIETSFKEAGISFKAFKKILVAARTADQEYRAQRDNPRRR